MTKEALKLALEALELIGMKNWSLREDKAITAIKEALAQPETDWERVARIKEEMLRVSFEDNKRLKEALAQPEPWEKFCDSNCVWTDHHPDCKLAESAPVAWLHRFIEGGISIGLKPADLERHPERWEPLYTTPPQRKPLSDEEIYKASTEAKMQEHYMGFHSGFIRFARAIERAHGIKE